MGLYDEVYHMAEEVLREKQEVAYDAGMRDAVASAIGLLEEPSFSKQDVISLLKTAMELRTALNGGI